MGFWLGLKKGWAGFVWMAKIIVPVSLFTAILGWSGLIERIDFLLKPLMGFFSLPSLAALPILIGMLNSVYGGIAAMAVLPFTTSQMTLIAVFILMAHSLIQEGIIQGKSGIHPLKATLVRLGGASVTILLIAPLVGSTQEMPPAALSALAATPTFTEMIRHWLMTTLALVLKVFFIITALLTFLEILKAMGWMNQVVWALSPLLAVMGLDRKVGLLWVAAVVFGLSYGGVIIVEEAKSGRLSPGELEILHLSIGMNHSMIEDPFFFLPLGVHPFWLYIPRLVMAIVTVRLLRLWSRYGRCRLTS